VRFFEQAIALAGSWQQGFELADMVVHDLQVGESSRSLVLQSIA
jgi:hypothetical protein